MNVAKNVHAESIGDFSNLIAYFAESDNAYCFACKLNKRCFLKAEILTGCPLTGMDCRIMNGYTVVEFKNQRKRELSDSRGRICRNIADRNAMPFGRFDVNYIEARCKNSDIFELWKLRNNSVVKHNLVVKNYVGILAPVYYFIG